MKMVSKAMPPFKALKILTKLNQKQGIDCPGCAWPDPQKRSKLGEFCENGIKAISEEATSRKAGNAFFQQHTIDELISKSDYWLGQQGRLQEPMIIREGDQHYEPVSWSEAFKIIAKQLKATNSPDRAVFYTSGRTSNEAAFLYQLFVRMYGTNNLPDCSNMCHESSGFALKQTLGIGKGSVTLEDFHLAEVIMIFGQNPATNHPRMLTTLEKAKQGGTKVITVNPLKEVGLVSFKNPQRLKGWAGSASNISDLYLQIRINEDVAFLKCLIKKLLIEEKKSPWIIDREFMDANAAFADDFLQDLEQYDLNELIARTGLLESQIDEAVEMIKEKKKIIVCWAMGLTQHVNAVDNIREIVNLLLLKGSIGKPGAGTCPVRGHSNVQGDRTVGISERPPRTLLDKLAKNFGFDPPRTHGYSVVEAIQAMHQKKVDVFFALGGNFLSAAPDTSLTSNALQNCALTVHVSTKLNRSHLVHGKIGIILPCLGRTDRIIKNGKVQFVSVENSMGYVHASNGVISSNSEKMLSEPEIVANIAKETVGNDMVDWDYLVDDFDRIRELIERSVPGFDKYNERITQKAGFHLPNGARVGTFNTPNQKAIFSINKLPNYTIAEGEYLLTTIRSHDQYNTTVYGLNDRYRGISNEREVIFMSKSDIVREGLSEGDYLDIVSSYDDITREVKGFKIKQYDIPERCLAMYFPEGNELIPLNHHSNDSLTPASKSVKVKIKKAEQTS